MTLEVSSAVVDLLRSEALRHAPLEACGILFGNEGKVEAALPTQNVHPTPATHFEIDPKALIQAYRAERDGGPKVIGFYHSHPQGGPKPSSTDQAQAAGDGKIWAIIGQGEVRFWLDAPNGFEPLSYTAVDH